MIPWKLNIESLINLYQLSQKNYIGHRFLIDRDAPSSMYSNPSAAMTGGLMLLFFQRLRLTSLGIALWGLAMRYLPSTPKRLLSRNRSTRDILAPSASDQVQLPRNGEEEIDWRMEDVD